MSIPNKTSWFLDPDGDLLPRKEVHSIWITAEWKWSYFIPHRKYVVNIRWVDDSRPYASTRDTYAAAQKARDQLIAELRPDVFPVLAVHKADVGVEEPTKPDGEVGDPTWGKLDATVLHRPGMAPGTGCLPIDLYERQGRQIKWDGGRICVWLTGVTGGSHEYYAIEFENQYGTRSQILVKEDSAPILAALIAQVRADKIKSKAS